MMNLKLKYEIPQVVYLDINSDTQTQLYKAWKKSMIRTGWLIHETEGWTRRGNGDKQKDTNIDIFATRRFNQDDI